MASFLALRRARHLCTAAASPLTISQFKKKLKTVSDPDECLKIYTSLTAAFDPSTSPTSARYALELTVRRLAKAHRFSDIKNLLESHKSLPQIKDEPFLSSVIRSYGVAGLLEKAVDTYTGMIRLSAAAPSSLSFNSLLTACVNCRAFDRVPAYFDEFPQKLGFQPDQFSFGILIKAYCEMNSPEKATEKLNEMDKLGLGISTISFTTILHSMYKNGRIDEAEQFWDEMVTKRGCVPDEGSYNVRLSCIHSGKPEAVTAVVEEMATAGIKPDAITFNYLMTCYCLNGMMDEAMNVYQTMVKTKGCYPNSMTYRTLVFYLCKKERYVSAYKVFKHSVKFNRIPNLETLKNLLEGLVKVDRLVEAKSMIRTLNKKFHPELLEAWRKVAEDVGLDGVGVEGVGSSEEEADDDDGEAVKGSR
ncbi:pentatricopeptide repeat-containing protein At4g36680, mitochondrial-like [Andrographis paniculata]|uniref:pentatricopeptide repeat-containing protein At4g36680, mitochondrial-like n=1 Tax=Andrographis paniculata TaxID=175694 RepID=UPI0021E9A09C|nr:pentatricopeptide repeat-containing protein At4g36680, mitochondrial-like [Andrographis paniculata]